MNLETALSDKGISLLRDGHHHCRPGWAQLDCPFCGQNSGKFHLGFNLSKRFFNCWQCGPKRGTEVLAAFGFSWKEAKEIFQGIERERDTAVAKVAAGKLTLPDHVSGMLPAHREYLRSRGFNPSQMKRLWGLKGIGAMGRLKWRLFIPIVWRGKTVSWTTRTIGAGTRYISANPDQEIIAHKSILYGGDFVRDSVVICEGPTDVWNIGIGAVCVFGLNVKWEQIDWLKDVPRRFVCFDNSAPALKRAKALAAVLSLYPGETSVIQIDADDPGSASAKEVQLIRECCFG